MVVSEFDKGRVIQFMTGTRATKAAAARKFHMSPQTVAAIVAGKKRTDYVAPAALSPKKKAIKERRSMVLKLVNKKVQQNCRIKIQFGSAKQIAVGVHELTGERPSVSTVTRDLHALGFKNFVRPKRTFAKKQVDAARKKFAGKKIWRDTATVRRIVFSDEHFADNNDRTCRTQWARAKERVEARTQLSRFNVPAVQFWAACGYNFKSPVVFVDFGKDEDGKTIRMNAKTYKSECLRPNAAALKRRRRLFMQDGARCHTAKLCRGFLEDCGLDYIKDWPAHSPDFNMIELVWALFDRRLALEPPARSKDELKVQVMRVWEELPQAFINNICMHFVRTMRQARTK